MIYGWQIDAYINSGLDEWYGEEEVDEEDYDDSFEDAVFDLFREEMNEE